VAATEGEPTDNGTTHTEVEPDAEQLERMLKEEEKKQQVLSQQIKLRDLKLKYEQSRKTTQALTDQLDEEKLDKEQKCADREPRNGSNNSELHVPNLGTLRQCPQVSAAAASLLNTYFPNVQGITESSRPSHDNINQRCVTSSVPSSCGLVDSLGAIGVFPAASPGQNLSHGVEGGLQYAMTGQHLTICH
jgi:hypothetical protein